jgi:hypothetical protein
MRLAYAVLAVTLSTMFPACAQDRAGQSAPLPPEEPYRPSLGEIMTLQQERHIKLWFAGSAGNWPLADYEIDKLGDGFDDVRKLLGPEIVDQHVGAALGALQKAIESKDASAFTAAFDKLSSGCNACHHDLDHAFVVIGRPASLPYSDQSFAPQK